MDIGKVLSGLYASEIPGGIAWVPDGGFDWWVGSIEFENAPARGGEETVEEAAQAMHAAALREYPDSEYARKATSSARELTPEKIAELRELLAAADREFFGCVLADEAVAALSALLDAAEELARIARFILDHPYAARGMGDECHGDWLKLQEMAHAVVEEATK